jgi:trimeric autotransporter adhesin
MKYLHMLKKFSFLIALLSIVCPLAFSQAIGTINTVAGGVPNNLPALQVAVGYPSAVLKDSSGNLYVGAESYITEGGEVYKISSSGTLTTVAGNGGLFYLLNSGDGGPATSAGIGSVSGLALDTNQNLYIADSIYGTVRKVTASTGIITTVVGGGSGCTGQTDVLGDGCPGPSASLSAPGQIFVDANGNLFITDSGNSRIRELVVSTGLMKTVAGGGTGCPNQLDTVGDGCSPLLATLDAPLGVYVDTHNNIFISDTSNERIRVVTAATGLIATIAGNGTQGFAGDGNAATNAEVSLPRSLFVDAAGDVYFSDSGNQRVREIVLSTGAIHTVIGGGTGCTGQTDQYGDGCVIADASLVYPSGVFVDSSSDVYVADQYAYRIREAVVSSGLIQTVVGNGTSSFSGDGLPATQAQLGEPYDVAVDSSGNLYIADLLNQRVREVNTTTHIISTVVGGGTGCLGQTDTYGDGCLATQATLFPFSVYLDASGNKFIADLDDNLIRKVSASTGIITAVAGGGTGCANQTDALGDGCPANQAILNQPWGIYVDPSGNIFFTDYQGALVREVVAATGLVKVIAGTGTNGFNGDSIPATQAQVNQPTGIYGDASGNIFFSDSLNYRIREILASNGNIITVAGTGTVGYNGDNIAANTAEIGSSYGLFIDHSGNLFFGDTGNARVREVVASTGFIQTVAGNGSFGFSGDGGSAIAAELGFTFGLAGDSNDNLFFSDLFNNRIREVFGAVPGNNLAISTHSLPAGVSGTAYSFTLQAVGGTTPYTWSLLSGSLPPGFSALSSAGVLSGTPTTTGTYNFTVKLTDAAANVQTQALSITIGTATVSLVSITIAPATPTLSVHSTQQFLAIGTYSDGSTQNLTSTVTWTSGTTSVTSINSVGLATALSAGTAIITATSGNISDETQLDVTPNPPYAYIGSVVSANCCLDVINTSNNQLVASIPVTTFNEPLGLSPDQSRVFVADNTNNLVDVIDTPTNTLRTTVPAGPGATAVVVAPNGKIGYVVDLGDNNMSVYDNSYTLIATIGLGFPAGWVSISPDGSLVYAGSSIDNRVAVLNTSTNTLVPNITIAPPPGQLTAGCIIGPVFNPAGTLGYFLQSCASTTAPGFLTVLALPGNTVVATIPVGILPYDLAITPDGSQLYVVNAKSNNVSVINTSTNTLTATIPVGNAPQSIAVTPDGSTVYVPNAKSSTVSLISTATNTVTSSFPLSTPFGIVIASPPAASPFLTPLVLTPPNLLFGSRIVSSTSTPQTITVRNPGTTAVTLTSISLIGPNPTDYSLVNSCPQPPATLGAGATCTLQATFKPLAAGSRLALVSIISTNGTSPFLQSAPLSGTGTGSTVSTFSGLTPSQSITVGAASVNLSGVIGNGSSFPSSGETISISINGITENVVIGANGAFSISFPTANIPVSATPYTITYSFPGDATFTSASNSSTTLTVNPLVSTFTLTVSPIGTGNGTVTDNLQQIDCITTAGVQSGTCAANYASGTVVILTATPSAPSTFAGWGGACSGTSGCQFAMNSAQSVTASFAPPPQMITLSFTPGTNQTGMATYDCPSNPNPSPTNPCTDPNAHAAALTIPQILQPFALTVQASEVPPTVADGICPNGATPSTDFDCRFTSFFTYTTLGNGNKIVPLCYPYANGNCVHYQVYSGAPGVEPNPSFYVGPIDWTISWNNDQFTPPSPYTGSTPHLYDDPDYAVSLTSPYGTNCSTPMLVGNPPVATNPPIYCQFEFDITTSFNPNKKVDAAITGRTKQFNDVVVAFPPANTGNLTISTTPTNGTVTAGSALSFVVSVVNSAGGPVSGATLTDAVPSGTNVSWSISPAYSGPGTCVISGAIGSQVLTCNFTTIAASQSFNISLLSSNSSIGTFGNTAVVQIGNQQILSIATITAQAVTASFSGLTSSQSILFGTTAVPLAGTIGNGTAHPAAGEIVSLAINGVTQNITIGANGAFSTSFPTGAIPASATPYTITYSFAGDSIFSSATNTATTLTVNSATTSYPLTITPIGTGNGTVTDNLQQIDCITTAGVQSGTCAANYASGTVVILTATPSAPSTFAGWGGACSGTSGCQFAMNSAQSVTASFAPPPQMITLSFTPGTNQTGMATYDCPSNPNPSPTNPCTDPNAHAAALTIPQILQPFALTVQASEVPPTVADGICPNGATPSTDFDCRFTSFFTYTTLGNGNKIVPLCYPYANGNCVHYQVYSGAPGVEPNPSFYVGPIDWTISWNNDQFTPPSPYTGSTPHLYDDPDYAVSLTSPYGTNCSTPMLVGNPPVATNPPIYCQFEFDITTSFNPNKKVDAAITGRTKQFNDVVVAFPPTTSGTLTVTSSPSSGTVTPGSPLSMTISVSNSAGGPVSGATLSDPLPAGTNISWSISPAYTGPGTCAITGAVGSQVLNCSFPTINASQSFSIGLLSPNSSLGTYTNTAVIKIGNQQILSIATLAVQKLTTTFSGPTASQAIYVGRTSITLGGTISSGSSYPAAGETVSIVINGATQTATIGANGAFSTSFPTATIPVATLPSSATYVPYTITYSYAGDAIFSAATNSSTTLTVKITGDVNGDGVVNCADLAIVKAAFGTKTGQAGFDPRADVNNDGVVNVLDLAIVARQVPAGTTCP